MNGLGCHDLSSGETHDVYWELLQDLSADMNTQLLSSGIFYLPEAALLLGMDERRLRSWVCGRSGAKGRPLIRAELPRIDRRVALSFVNLIEAKFIEIFASKGVSVLSMRYMAEEAERFLGVEHPFATDWIFKTDGKKIFVEATERANDPCLYDLRGHNFAMHAVVSNEFKKDVQFAASGMAKAWFPRKAESPNVRVSPKIAFGRPAMMKSGVPTEALYASFLADDKDADSVSRWFDVAVADVEEAVRFEQALKLRH